MRGWCAIRGHDQNLQPGRSTRIVVWNELSFSKQVKYTLVKHSTGEFSEDPYI